MSLILVTFLGLFLSFAIDWRREGNRFKKH